LVHEKKSAPQATRIHVPNADSDDGSSTSESEDEIVSAVKTTTKPDGRHRFFKLCFLSGLMVISPNRIHINLSKLLKNTPLGNLPLEEKLLHT
jgi:hypothetical protein